MNGKCNLKLATYLSGTDFEALVVQHLKDTASLPSGREKKTVA